MPGMSTRWRVVIVLGSIMVVGLATAAVVIPRVWRSGDAPKAAAREYLVAVQRNDFDTGYGLLCGRLRKAVSQERYAAQMDALNMVSPIVGFNVFFGLANPMAKDAKVNVDVGTTTRTFVKIATMRKEGGEWHWCGVTGVNQLGASKLDPRQ